MRISDWSSDVCSSDLITFALIWRDYWALIVGMLAGKAIRMAMSYVMHSFRPRLSLAAGREIMHFSKWILVTGLVTLVNRRGGTLLIAKFLDASSVGTFAIASQISNRSEEHTSELQSPMRNS